MADKKKKPSVLRRELGLEFLVFKRRESVVVKGRDDGFVASYSNSYDPVVDYSERVLVNSSVYRRVRRLGKVVIIDYWILPRAFTVKKNEGTGRTYILDPNDPNLVDLPHPHPFVQNRVWCYDRQLYLIRVRMGCFGETIRESYKRVNKNLQGACLDDKVRTVYISRKTSASKSNAA